MQWGLLIAGRVREKGDWGASGHWLWYPAEMKRIHSKEGCKVRTLGKQKSSQKTSKKDVSCKTGMVECGQSHGKVSLEEGLTVSIEHNLHLAIPQVCLEADTIKNPPLQARKVATGKVSHLPRAKQVTKGNSLVSTLLEPVDSLLWLTGWL